MMGYFGGGVFGWLFMLLFWGLIVLGIVALIKWLGASSSGRLAKKTALEILEERYAREEIDREEYEQKKSDLQS